MVAVFNLATGEGVTYVGISAQAAEVAAPVQFPQGVAHEHREGVQHVADANTWDYQARYGHIVVRRRVGVSCGDWAALEGPSRQRNFRRGAGYVRGLSLGLRRLLHVAVGHCRCRGRDHGRSGAEPHQADLRRCDRASGGLGVAVAGARGRGRGRAWHQGERCVVASGAHPVPGPRSRDRYLSRLRGTPSGVPRDALL